MVGALSFFFKTKEHRGGDMRQVKLGSLASTSPLTLFALFDKWRAGTYPLCLDMDCPAARDEAIRRAI
jgi:hypothetical protein